jgi:ABC-type uncharacterized transport system auxiliary subunit
MSTLAGCASGAFDSDLPYQQVYVIAAPAANAGGTPIQADLTVELPIVRPGLDTDRIAVLYADRRMDYFSASRWSGNLDLVVQSLLVQSLRNTSRLRTVQGDVSPFGSKYVLQTELTDFQAEYGAAGGMPEVHVAFVGTLGRIADSAPLATFSSTARVPAAGNTLGAIVAAFEQAYQEAARDAVTRTLTAIEQAESTQATAAPGEG